MLDFHDGTPSLWHLRANGNVKLVVASTMATLGACDQDAGIARISICDDGLCFRVRRPALLRQTALASYAALIAARLDDQDYVDAKPYAIRSLDKHRLVYGEWHRETAYALQDLASLDRLTQPAKFSADAIQFMREAIEIRRRVLGPDHLEVAGGERELSEQLYEQWRHDARRQPQDPHLSEATGAATHAYVLLECAAEVSPPQSAITSDERPGITGIIGTRSMDPG